MEPSTYEVLIMGLMGKLREVRYDCDRVFALNPDTQAEQSKEAQQLLFKLQQLLHKG